MKKFICKKCVAAWYSAADVTICPECRGELKEVSMTEKMKAPSEAVTSSGAKQNI